MTSTADHVADWLLRFPDPATYRQAIGQYTDWLETEGLDGADEEQINRAVIQKYIRHLRSQGYADSTVRKKISAVSSFYSYLVLEKIFTANPADETVRPQGESAPRYGLTVDEAHRLLEAAADYSRSANALIWLQIGAGLRISEACTARIQDLDTDRALLTVTVKRGHRRTKPLSPPVLKAVLAQIGDRTEGRILTNANGNPLSRHRGWELVHRLTKTAGIKRDVTDHELRNTAAELMLAAGARIEDVSSVLGHKNLETTLRYVRNRDELAGMTKAVSILGEVLTEKEGRS